MTHIHNTHQTPLPAAFPSRCNLTSLQFPSSSLSRHLYNTFPLSTCVLPLSLSSLLHLPYSSPSSFLPSPSTTCWAAAWRAWGAAQRPPAPIAPKTPPHRPCPPPHPTHSPTPPLRACHLLLPSPPTPTTPVRTPSRCPSNSPALPSLPHGPWVQTHTHTHTCTFLTLDFSDLSPCVCQSASLPLCLSELLYCSGTDFNTKTCFHMHMSSTQVSTCSGRSHGRESHVPHRVVSSPLIKSGV